MVARFRDMEEVGGSNPPSPTIKVFLEQMSALIPVGPTKEKVDYEHEGWYKPECFDKFCDEARYSTRPNMQSYDGEGWYPTEAVVSERHYIRAAEENTRGASDNGSTSALQAESRGSIPRHSTK